jgi:hypothetical protein
MIKIYSKEEAPEILPVSHGRNTLLRVKLLQLKVGEYLELPKEDWKTKNTPRYIVAAIKKKFGFEYEWGKKIDGTGWAFRRVK